MRLVTENLTACKAEANSALNARTELLKRWRPLTPCFSNLLHKTFAKDAERLSSPGADGVSEHVRILSVSSCAEVCRG